MFEEGPTATKWAHTAELTLTPRTSIDLLALNFGAASVAGLIWWANVQSLNRTIFTFICWRTMVSLPDKVCASAAKTQMIFIAVDLLAFNFGAASEAGLIW